MTGCRESLAETTAYRGYQIELHWDNDGRGFDDYMFDEPCAIVYSGGYGRMNILYDNCGRSLPDYGVLRAVRDSDANALADEFGFERRDTEKRFGFEDDGLVWHWYKTEEKLFAGILKYTGNETMRVDELSSQRDVYFFVWYQDELDKYAGLKNAMPMVETCQNILDGEIYGYVIVKDNDYDGLGHDSCWGFIGDSDGCIREAKRVVDHDIERDRKIRQARIKEMVRNHVPLETRQAELSA